MICENDRQKIGTYCETKRKICKDGLCNNCYKDICHDPNNYYSAPARSSHNYFSIDGEPDYEDIILAMAESDYD